MRRQFRARLPALVQIALVLIAVVLMAIVLIAVPPAVHAAAVRAPAFTLELFNGRALSLADLRGTAVILLFWANW